MERERSRQTGEFCNSGKLQGCSHVKDGLLIPDHRAVAHRQRVVAALQVKVLERQLDHLDDGRAGTSGGRVSDGRRTNQPGRGVSFECHCQPHLSHQHTLPLLAFPPSFFSILFSISDLFPTLVVLSGMSIRLDRLSYCNTYMLIFI